MISVCVRIRIYHTSSDDIYLYMSLRVRIVYQSHVCTLYTVWWQAKYPKYVRFGDKKRPNMYLLRAKKSKYVRFDSEIYPNMYAPCGAENINPVSLTYHISNRAIMILKLWFWICLMIWIYFIIVLEVQLDTL